MASTINVLLVDDHDLVRAGICRLLSDVPGIKVVAEARTGEEAIRIVREKKPDVILMDVKMPGIGGLEATRKMLKFDGSLKIIILTVCETEPFPSKLLQAGALGYLTKGSGTQDMVTAIRTVYAGRRYLGADIAQQMALRTVEVENHEGSLFKKLSERELQIALMITNGKSPQTIAGSLNLSPKTIHTYRGRIFGKLNVKSNVELTLFALREGLLETESTT